MSFDLMFSQAVKMHENGQIDEAEQIYRELLTITPHNPDLLHLIGLIAHHKHAFSSAVDFIGQAVALKPNHVPFIFSLAYALQEWGKYFEALENYYKIIELEPNIPETWNNMGNIYRLQGELNKAQECFEKALNISPSLVIALNNLSLLYIDWGEIGIAKKHLLSALEIKPDYDEALFNLANLERNQGHYEEALNHYRTALKINPKFVRCFNSMGVALEQLKEFDQAEEAFMNALKIDSKNAETLKNLANVLFFKGLEAQAEQKYKEALQIDHNLFDAHANLGHLLQKQGRLEEALEHYRRAVIINPKQPEVCNNLALAVQACGELEEAIGLFCNSLYLKPGLIQTKYNLALAIYNLYRSQDQEKAIKIAENWVRNFKNDPIAKHLLYSLKGETNSQKADARYISEFFDAFADDFDHTLQKLNYQTPIIIKGLLADLLNSRIKLKILDLGCGTGLCGVCLKPYAQELTGVDLSSAMLEKAQAKNIYDCLEREEITAYLSKEVKFELIVATDVLCYFGDLQSVCALIKASLTPKGYAIFSIEEELGGAEYKLYPQGRFKHSLSYLEEVLNKTELKIIVLQQEQLRLEKEEAVLGIIAVVQNV